MPNFGTGIYLYSDEFYLGLSTPKLLKNDYKNLGDIENSGSEEQHFFIIGGYLFKIDDKWKAKPSFSLKMVEGSPLSVDVTANAIYNDKIWFGIMYRAWDAAGAIFQYQVTDRLRAGYSYDVPSPR
ncbi:MAG: PorP/SprF family type IX secretion system membrane protein [Chloroflexia bacterium]|nr:PorP/SprF family type IX secretion system membrane protein [Chloroflexia bacterium]